MTYEELVFLTTANDIKTLELDTNHMVKLCQINGKNIEALIAKDPAYQPYAEKYFRSLGKKTGFTLDEYKNIIRRIATENSTHTATASSDVLAEYISRPDVLFENRLKEGDYTLVDEIDNYVYENAVTSRGRHAHIKSLASKLCRYLEEWIYGNDNFTIYDSFVRKMLPYYVWSTTGNKTKVNLEKCSYVQFMEEFNKVYNGLHPTLQRHTIDHIIWYSYKNDAIRCAIGEALGKRK